ncbi:MAG: hypothetical protein MJE77_20725 [Proteobacteria bacterium]|nr:hypothetical protein [Pseudomonadota bacterium]
MHNVRVLLLAGVLSLSACVTAKRYVLKVDAARPGKATLCNSDSTDNADDAEDRCRSFGGQTLDAPGTLAIVVTNPADSTTYQLRTEQAVSSKSPHSPRGILSEVLDRFGKLSGGFIEELDPDDPDKKSKSHDTAIEIFKDTRKQLEKIGQTAAAKAVDAHLGKLVAGPVETDRQKPRSARFTHYLDRDGKAMTMNEVIRANDSVVVLGAPAFAYPPARFFDLDQADIDEINDKSKAKQRSGLRAEVELARHVLDACDPKNLGKTPYQGFLLWAQYLAAYDWDQLTGQTVLGALDVDRNTIESHLSGALSLDLQRTMRELRKQAYRAQQADKPVTGAAKVLDLLSTASRINRDSGHCKNNIEFVLSKLHRRRDAALRGRLETLKTADDGRASIGDMIDRTRTASQIFRTYLEPMVQRVVIQSATGTHSGREIGFGAVSLRAGKMTIEVTAEQDRSVSKLVRYQVPVAASPTVAVSVGPIVSLCRVCFQTVEEKPKPNSQPGDASQLVKVKSDAAVGNAALVHVTLLSESWFRLGACLGYPLDPPAETTNGLLAGVSMSHRIGVLLSLGIHIFQTRRLKPGYGSEIDRTRPELAGLTADSVTREAHSAAFFVHLGLTTELLSRL